MCLTISILSSIKLFLIYSCAHTRLQSFVDGNIQATLEELLSFITGADQIPPTGFSKCIDITFYATETGVKRLPHASTCSLEFYLPRGVGDPNVFKEMMLMSLKECIGFEKI